MLASVAMIADNLKFSGAVALQSQAMARCGGHLQVSRPLTCGIMHLSDDVIAITLLPDEDTGMQRHQGLVA